MHLALDEQHVENRVFIEGQYSTHGFGFGGYHKPQVLIFGVADTFLAIKRIVSGRLRQVGDRVAFFVGGVHFFEDLGEPVVGGVVAIGEIHIGWFY
jgi:hypothetical protein